MWQGVREALLKEPRGKPLGGQHVQTTGVSGLASEAVVSRQQVYRTTWLETWDRACGFPHSETGSHGGILSRQVTPSKVHFSQDPSGCLCKMDCREERVREKVGRPWRSHQSLQERSGWIQEGAALRNWWRDHGRAELGEGPRAAGTEAGLVEGDKRREVRAVSHLLTPG